MAEKSNERIIFFDGVCGLCNRSVDFIIRRKNANRFKFSPLQGEAAKRMLQLDDSASFNTFIYFRSGDVKTRSDAALFVLIDLGRLWPLAGIFLIVPKFIRDGIYNWVSRNRYQWFGKKESCRLPSPEERAYFLD